jgi:DNA-binding NarL/FixJ family response regulator
VTRVFLVDDHTLFRAGVRAELQGEPGIELVGEAGDVSDAVDGIVAADPEDRKSVV